MNETKTPGDATSRDDLGPATPALVELSAQVAQIVDEEIRRSVLDSFDYRTMAIAACCRVLALRPAVDREALLAELERLAVEADEHPSGMGIGRAAGYRLAAKVVADHLGSSAAPRDDLGRTLREVWVAWAREQPDAKPSWLVPWEQLDEAHKEVDRRMAEALYELGALGSKGMVAFIRSQMQRIMRERLDWAEKCCEARTQADHAIDVAVQKLIAGEGPSDAVMKVRLGWLAQGAKNADGQLAEQLGAALRRASEAEAEVRRLTAPLQGLESTATYEEACASARTWLDLYNKVEKTNVDVARSLAESNAKVHLLLACVEGSITAIDTVVDRTFGLTKLTLTDLLVALRGSVAAVKDGTS